MEYGTILLAITEAPTVLQEPDEEIPGSESRKSQRFQGPTLLSSWVAINLRNPIIWYAPL